MKPGRIQCSRKKGFRLPAGAVYVGRPSKWGNPFRVSEELPIEQAVARYAAALESGELRVGVEDVQRELCGKSLACWCKPGSPCHADMFWRLPTAASGADGLDH